MGRKPRQLLHLWLGDGSCSSPTLGYHLSSCPVSRTHQPTRFTQPHIITALPCSHDFPSPHHDANRASDPDSLTRIRTSTQLHIITAHQFTLALSPLSTLRHTHTALRPSNHPRALTPPFPQTTRCSPAIKLPSHIHPSIPTDTHAALRPSKHHSQHNIILALFYAHPKNLGI